MWTPAPSDTCGARAHPRESGVCRPAESCSGAQLRRPRSSPQPHARPLLALRLLRLGFRERSRRKASIRTPAPRRRAPCRRQWVLSFRRPRCALRALGAARERVHVTNQRHRDRRAAAPAAPGGGRRPGRPRLQVSNVRGRSTPMPSSKPVIHRDLPASTRLHSAWRGVRFNKPASVTATGSRR